MLGGADCQLREVHAAAFPKDQLQFADGQGQHRHGRLHRFPLCFREARRRRLPEALQRFEQRIVVPQPGKQSFVARFQTMVLVKAQVAIHLLAPVAVFGEQQLDHRCPLRKILQTRLGKRGQLEQCHDVRRLRRRQSPRAALLVHPG